MDDLIRAYVVLYEQYTNLQAQMDKISGTAFIQLSRCRYNGIKISPDQFRPETDPFISVLCCPADNKLVSSTGNPEDTTHIVLKEKSNNVVASENDPDIGSISDSLKEIKVSDTSIESNQRLGTRDPMDRLVFQLDKSQEKKNNPTRDIEVLPSTILRQTQSSFQNLVNLGLEIATIVVRIGQLEEEIRAFDDDDENSSDSPKSVAQHGLAASKASSQISVQTEAGVVSSLIASSNLPHGD